MTKMIIIIVVVVVVVVVVVILYEQNMKHTWKRWEMHTKCWKTWGEETT